eukprot:TRINITY_DN15329_c0_g1_i1.p1 TRINITY_DN15329_c0_g1~~TRINITY_DN15329_c0_g1_i1.p1  ORF type:complete len:236 (-),score=70.72 TRINITY_DN15329_c0_g1_i1:29-736(-)
MSSNAAAKLLMQQYQKLQSDPVEGFAVEIDESNIFEWKIYIEGPKQTLYEGGIFQLLMKFPTDYPMSPPDLKFVSEFWHPNVYDNGKVCISILHPPVNDDTSGERPEERWLPTQSPSTILLSVISLLSDPNFSSPANVDASVMWRRNPQGNQKKCKELVDKANRAFDGHIKIPHPDTDPEERKKYLDRLKELNKPMDIYDGVFDDDYGAMDDDDIGEECDDDYDEDMDFEEDEDA